MGQQNRSHILMVQPGKEEGTKADAPDFFAVFLWMRKNPKEEREETEAALTS